MRLLTRIPVFRWVAKEIEERGVRERYKDDGDGHQSRPGRLLDDYIDRALARDSRLSRLTISHSLFYSMGLLSNFILFDLTLSLFSFL
jgi:hypothetical protein